MTERIITITESQFKSSLLNVVFANPELTPYHQDKRGFLGNFDRMSVTEIYNFIVGSHLDLLITAILENVTNEIKSDFKNARNKENHRERTLNDLKTLQKQVKTTDPNSAFITDIENIKKIVQELQITAEK